MSDKKPVRTKLTLPKGTQLVLDGEPLVIESCEITIKNEHLYAVGQEDPVDTMTEATIEAETWEPESSE